MNFIEGLKNWWNDFKTEFATEKRTVQQVKEEEVDDINEDLDYDRGVARGQHKQEQRKNQELEESIESNRQKNVSQYLQKQKQQLKNKNFRNATSVKRLLNIAEKKEVKLLSRDMQQDFGKLQDIWFTQTGQMAIVMQDNNGEPVPIAAGPQTTDIFRNPGGLRNEVKNGVIAMNVNKQGQPVETPENQRVPDMIMGPNGEFTYTEADQQQYLDVIGDKLDQVSTWRKRAGAAEKAMASMSQRINELERDLETANSVSQGTQEALDSRLEEMKNAIQHFNKIERDSARVTNLKQMNEELIKDIQAQRDKFTEQVASNIDKDEMDAKEDEIRRVSNMTIDMLMQMANASGSISDLVDSNSTGNGGNNAGGTVEEVE